jgi:hypothetical protein
MSDAPLDDDQLSRLAAELGALVAELPGVRHVRARPGFGRLVREALDGLSAVVGGGAGGGADAGSSAAATASGRPVPVVGLAVTRDETRVTLDLVVAETASGPLVAREVATRLLDRLASEPLPAASLDVRIVGVEA